MWIETLTLENIKCFQKQTIRLGTTAAPYPWITFLGENGTGKSTVLQALAIMLAGPEGANQLLKPEGWLNDQHRPGKLTLRLHQGEQDPGLYSGDKKTRKAFQYTLYITGNDTIEINNKVFTEPVIAEDTNNTRVLSWLRQNALLPKGKGWFGAGYGAFRRLSRNNRIIVPALQNPLRYTNFYSQFREDEPLEAFETWMIYLDYRISKDNDTLARKQKQWGIEAFNKLLPEGNSFDSIDANGRIWFNVHGQKVSTLVLSDGFRSILAFAGDLVWRMIAAFPDSANPLLEQGVVLLDELDIHLHPVWQRTIAGLLRQTFPNVQFVMATHSPLIAAGAGEDAVTLRFFREQEGIQISKIDNLHTQSVDSILESEAFGLVSAFSPAMQHKIDQYFALKRKTNLTQQDEQQLKLIFPDVKAALGASTVEKTELEVQMDSYIKRLLQ